MFSRRNSTETVLISVPLDVLNFDIFVKRWACRTSTKVSHGIARSCTVQDCFVLTPPKFKSLDSTKCTAGSLSGALGPSDVHSTAPSTREGELQPQRPSGTCLTFGHLCNILHKVLIVINPHRAGIQLRGESVDGQMFAKRAFPVQYHTLRLSDSKWEHRIIGCA